MDAFGGQEGGLGGVVRGEAAGGAHDTVAGEIGIGGRSHDTAHEAEMIGPAA